MFASKSSSPIIYFYSFIPYIPVHWLDVLTHELVVDVLTHELVVDDRATQCKLFEILAHAANIAGPQKRTVSDADWLHLMERNHFVERFPSIAVPNNLFGKFIHIIGCYSKQLLITSAVIL